jgi:hypothetical protein
MFAEKLLKRYFTVQGRAKEIKLRLLQRNFLEMIHWVGSAKEVIMKFFQTGSGRVLCKNADLQLRELDIYT